MAILVREFDPTTLKPSPANKRTFQKDDAQDQNIVSLAQSIASDGQIQPIVVRPVNGHHEIVVGERRARACRLLNKPVLGIEKNIDDKQAAMLTASENAEREDLTPVETAETFQVLLDKGWTHAEIADHLKKPLSYVVRRIQLTTLSKKWRDVATDPESFAHAWNAVHFEKIAKFPPDVQDSILQNLKGHFRGQCEVAGWTTKMLAGYLAQFLHSLDNAPWKKDDDTLVVKAGSCAACKKRSDYQRDLFDDDDLVAVNNWGRPTGKVKRSARCLDSDCWEAKMFAHLKAKESELAAAHNAAPLILANGAYKIKNWPEYSEHPYRKRVESLDGYQTCKESDKGAKPALIVDGPQQGQTVFVKKNGEASGPSGNRSTQKKHGEKKSLKERRANLEMLRSRIVASKLIDCINKKPGRPSALTQEEVLALILTFGTPPGYMPYNQTYKKFDLLKAAAVGELVDTIYTATLPVIASSLHSRIVCSSGTNSINRDFLVATCYVLDVEYKTLYAAACEEKPEPKSWATLEADAKAAKKPAKTKAGAKAEAKPGKLAKPKGGKKARA